nr:hypothetical protein [Paenibacillus alvei]
MSTATEIRTIPPIGDTDASSPVCGSLPPGLAFGFFESVLPPRSASSGFPSSSLSPSGLPLLSPGSVVFPVSGSVVSPGTVG